MGQKAPQFWTSDLEFTDCTELAIPDFDIGYSYNISVADDGTDVVCAVKDKDGLIHILL